jgi:nucleotide-binding universal stress UspA family protein
MAGAVTATGGLIGESPDLDKLKKDALQYLSDICKEQLADCAKVQLGVLSGEVPEEIVNYINNHEVGFVVMTTHARTGLSRATLGSIADQVVRHTKNHPLLVEHPRVNKNH